MARPRTINTNAPYTITSLVGTSIKTEDETDVPGETKNQKFRRLANQRARQLTAYMKLVGRLGGPSYDRSPEEVEKLVLILEREFAFMVEQLRHGAQSGKTDDIF